VEYSPDGCEDCLPYHGVEEEVYIQQLEGFVIHGKESHVCKLKKYFYGIKQALRTWYSRIDSYL